MPAQGGGSELGSERYDAVVVGAGAIGLACAWRAAQRGLRVCVLERGEPGTGASEVAAGMLVPVTEVDFGEDALLALKLASADAFPGFVRELEDASGLSTGYRRDGALYVALDRDESEALRRLHALQRSLGLEVEWLSASECRALEAGIAPACAGGILAPGDGQVDPRALVDALEAAASASGVRIVGGAEVTAALVEGSRIAGVETADRTRYEADRVVLACGCWSGSATWLPEGARPPVRPVKGQVVHLRGAPGALADRPVHTAWVYVVPRPDGRVVLGATVEEQGFDVSVTAGAVLELLREAYRVLPGTAELELVGARAGLRPGTPDNAPIIGEGMLEGLVLATGHYRNGILLAPVTAEAVADVLAGDAPDPIVSRFGPGRFSAVRTP
jgi:glycine oxidase